MIADRSSTHLSFIPEERKFKRCQRFYEKFRVHPFFHEKKNQLSVKTIYGDDEKCREC